MNFIITGLFFFANLVFTFYKLVVDKRLRYTGT